MREIKFDRSVDIPVIDAVIKGPLRSHRLKLVFDTGCAITQIDTGAIECVGYSAVQGEALITMSGATGDRQEGYTVKTAALSNLGLQFENALVGVMDFDHLQQDRIDGLLGFDLIKELHIEVDGPSGVLKILSP